ncbi:hypothetical protein [Algoriphagus winogradskyi]|uniref:DUF4959 domain-containing protein n=1 Tax=Algoriphagus winogradskyi TaxID=237017 RepID=A0ABY1N853_9BACT|nr:hypothetical protein [Algoriphagus winogradskyi]SMP02239.1 hypothetical protein SAMN06265367_10187 [Algoriphagus winogradskyi]
MRKILSVLFVTLTLLSCTSEENPVIPPTEEFSIYVEKEYKADNQTKYAVLHNGDGSVLDFKEVINDDTLKFTLPESTVYHLTIYSSDVYNGAKHSILSTYLNITANGSITLGLPTESTLISGEKSNNFEVKVNHSGNIKIIGISNAIGNKSTSSTVSSNYASAEMTSDKDLDEHLISLMDMNGRSYYKLFFIEEGKINYTFDFEEFKTYEHEIQIENQELNFSSLQVHEMVIRNNALKRAFSRMVFPAGFFGDQPENYTLGFMDGFSIYETSISARVRSNSNLSLFIRARFSALPTLDLATPQTLQIKSENLSNFGLILPASFERWSARWRYQENNTISMAWSIYGNTTEIPEFKMPAELVEQNDHLQKISDLKLETVTAIKGKYTYEEWLLNEFVERNDPLEFQEVTWTELY